ncbi:MAG: 2-succinyl-5-enolpyruvyl-6-hydroxy-3-cyclohexene-1-carboxylic-acid synthase [Calditrichia bacterium]
MIDTSNMNILWGSLIIEELLRNGVDYFCISPGSRSTPLTAAIAHNNRANHIICFDERGAAFHALGYARATWKPAALISTSGTAAANYLPAVVEASVEGLPMIILTADRPPELRQTAANQTIDQTSLFGKYVRWLFDLPCPDENISPQMVLTTVDQVVYRSRRQPAGPVHMNCMFREPLAPEPQPVSAVYRQGIAVWMDNPGPYTKYSLSTMHPDEETIGHLTEILNKSKRGWLLVGRLNDQTVRGSVARLVKQLNWPVFPDITSGLRLGKSMSAVIHYFDQLLLFKEEWQEFKPEAILHIGGTFVSKRLLQFLEHNTPENYILVQRNPFRQDPNHQVTLRIEADIPWFCDAIIPHLKGRGNPAWLENFKQKSMLVDERIDNFLSTVEKVNEIAIARQVSRMVPENHALYLASSMPVRDMDMYGAAKSPTVAAASNRGASGIDGTVASAIGYAVGAKNPVTLLIGDLAMIHDLNSLSQLSAIHLPVIIVVLNNHGGGIFSFLPVAEFSEIFEEYFGTPHPFSFQQAAAMFGVDYARPRTMAEFEEVYNGALKKGQSTLIEIMTDRKENANLHKRLQSEIRQVLQNKK